MSGWIPGAALALLVAAAGLPYVWLVRRASHLQIAGMRALAALRWREFSTLVGQAMQQRGLRDAGRDGDSASREGASSRMLMTDGRDRWLLSCKHGLAYRLGRGHVEELAGEMDLAGARHGILLTEGRAMREALSAAVEQDIEVVDGRRLWALVRPHLPAATRAQVEALADTRARTEVWAVILAAVVLGAAAMFLAPSFTPDRPSAREPAPTGAPAAAPAASPLPPEPEPLPEDADIEAYPDADTLLRYQGEVARAVSHLPGVQRAHWLTGATLVVNRTGSIEAIWPLLCAELERYPALRTTRVQLNPRPGDEEPVRWRQCRTQ